MAAGKRRGTTMPGMKHPSAEYECYADLAGAQVEGADFQIHIERRAFSGIAVVAPHGGAIEEGTSEMHAPLQARNSISTSSKGCAPPAAMPRST